jgi:outer membrane protein insertion porin family
VSLALLLAAGEPIEDVRIVGNRRIPADTIKYQIQTKPGALLKAEVLRADIRRLYALGYFDDIRVDEQSGQTGPIIVFTVKEKKTVRSIKYEGLNSITSSEVLDKLKEKRTAITQESTYDPLKVKQAEGIIKMMLAEKGRQNATVRAVIEDVPTNSVAITFKVNEGPKIRIQKIDIQGNTVFSSGDIRGAMKLIKQAGPSTVFTGKDSYFDLKLADDITRIRMLYAEHGYIRINIEEPVIEVKPKTLPRTLPSVRLPFPWGIPLPFWKKTLDRYYITIKIQEGKQYRVGTVAINGNRQFDEATIRKTLGLVPGEIFNEALARKNFEELKKLYGAKGYINFTAVPVQNYDEAKNLLNLSINIEEDRPYIINRISFSGNTTTRDKVIRRELMVDETQVFNTSLWDKSMQRLNQLGYFEQIKPEDVDIKPSPTDSSVDINLKIREKNRNQIGINGGISGIGGGFVGLNYETNNFLGLGDTLALTLQGGTRESNYQLSFTEPYLFSRPWSAGFTVFDSRLKYDQSQQLFGINGTPLPAGVDSNNLLNFEQKSFGYNVFTTHPYKIWNRFGLNFGMNHSQTSAINAATEEYFDAIRTQENQSLISVGGTFSNFHAHTLIPSFTRNRTQGDPFSPQKGSNLSLTFEYTGGFLAGTVNYFRPALDYRFYVPMNKGRNTLAVRLLGAHVQGFRGTAVPYYQRLFLGGDFDIRGFDFREITPIAYILRNVSTTNAQTGVTTTASADDIVYVGGDTQGVLNLEYRIPVVGQVFTLAPFLDVGNSLVLMKDQLTRQVLNSNGQLVSLGPQFLPGTNSGVRSSTGLEFQVMLPIIRAPFRVIFALNPNRVHNTFVGPATGTPFQINEAGHNIKFTIGRTF